MGLAPDDTYCRALRDLLCVAYSLGMKIGQDEVILLNCLRRQSLTSEIDSLGKQLPTSLFEPISLKGAYRAEELIIGCR